MIDIARIRRDPDGIKADLLRKGEDPSVLDSVLEDDGIRRARIADVETLRAKRNEVSKAIGQAKKRGEDTEPIQQEVRRIGQEIARLDAELQEIEGRQRDRLLRIPNLPDSSVPDGADESANVAVSEWGKKPAFSFEPKAHDDLGVALGILDFERAAKVSGSRFVLCKGLGAALERALIGFMLDLHVRDHGYEEVIPPYLVRAEALVGTGNLPKFEEDLFRVDNGDYYLIPTAEVPVTNIHREEILPEERLPISYCAFTPCFRSEAGSHGKDTKGMIRLHQFHKVELVKFVKPDESYDQLERLTADAEKVLQLLGLHYRKVVLCAGDMSFSSAKTYDLEVWLPSQGRYREISSCSNFEDFQARRAGIRYRPKEGGKPRYVHTLNGSGLAIGRTVVAILEQFQQENGSVRIPEMIMPYMHGCAVIGVDIE